MISPRSGARWPPPKAGQLLRLTRSLGDEVTHLLLHFGGVALGASDLAGFVFLEAQDADKLFTTFGANVFIGGHETPPGQRDYS